MESPPTGSPTAAGGEGAEWYPDYSLAWSDGLCKNTTPLPFDENDRPLYDTQLECCQGAYGGQASNACIEDLESPPTSSPTAVEPEVFYPDYSLAWPAGVCISDRPLPSGRPTYSTKEECCSGAYGAQPDKTCVCDADPCHSCDCPDSQDKTDCIAAEELTCED